MIQFFPVCRKLLIDNINYFQHGAISVNHDYKSVFITYQCFINGTVVKELIVWPESPSIVLVVLIWLSVVFLENKAFSEAAKIVVVETETSLISFV
jgi:hypothetical protein